MENKPSNTAKNIFVSTFIKTDDILTDMREIIDSAQKAAFHAVNIALVQRNWLIGYRIAGVLKLRPKGAARVSAYAPR